MLFNSFRNDWVLKIRIDGKSLKKLLMIPYDNASGGTGNSWLVVDGVSFTKSEFGTNGTTLAINKLKDD